MWLEASEIRQKFNIQQNAYPSQIENAIATAGRKVRLWVDEETYGEAVADEPPVDDDDEIEAEKILRYETVIDAHAWLTMYYLAKAVGSKLGQDGFVFEAQDSASVEGSRVITNKYLKPSERSISDYWETARELLDPYITEVAETLLDSGGTSFANLEIVY